MTCDRCHGPAPTSTMSRFNTEMICMTCLAREMAHPKYSEARAAEEAAVRAGDLNFPGIGKPVDL